MLDDLPHELLSLILGHANVLAQPVFRCVTRKWCAMVDANQAIMRDQESHAWGLDYVCVHKCAWYGCADKYACKVASMCWWSVFDWMIGCAGERGSAMEKACIVAAEFGDLERLGLFHNKRGSYHICSEATTVAVRCGQLPVVEWLHSKGLLRVPFMLHEAIEYARWEILEWAREKALYKVSSVYSAAATSGNSDTVERVLFRENRSDAVPYLANAAAACGSIRLLDLAVERGCSPDACTYQRAVEANHLHIVEWLHVHGYGPPTAACAAAAARRGLLDMLQLLHGYGCPMDPHVCREAAAGNHLDVLVWASARDCPRDDAACLESAAAQGHLRILEWMMDHGYVWYLHAMTCAVRNGHNHILAWAIKRRYALPTSLCATAAERGRIGALQMAFQAGCGWDERVCAAAAASGSIRTLQWARARACPWDIETTYRAAQRGHLGILQWLCANGCPHDFEVLRLCAHEQSTQHMLEWIDANSAPSTVEAPARTLA